VLVEGSAVGGVELGVDVPGRHQLGDGRAISSIRKASAWSSRERVDRPFGKFVPVADHHTEGGQLRVKSVDARWPRDDRPKMAQGFECLDLEPGASHYGIDHQRGVLVQSRQIVYWPHDFDA